MLDQVIGFFKQNPALGAGILIIIGGAWKLFTWFHPRHPGIERRNKEREKEREREPAKEAYPRPAPGPVVHLHMPQTLPKIHLTGRNTWNNLPSPSFMGFGICFLIFWCAILLAGVATIFREANGFSVASALFLVPFGLVTSFMLYLGVAMLLNQLAIAFGKVRFVATPQMAVFTTEFTSVSSQSITVEADEFSFQDPFFVERKTKYTFPLPQLPKVIRPDIVAFLSEHWK